MWWASCSLFPDPQQPLYSSFSIHSPPIKSVDCSRRFLNATVTSPLNVLNAHVKNGWKRRWQKVSNHNYGVEKLATRLHIHTLCCILLIRCITSEFQPVSCFYLSSLLPHQSLPLCRSPALQHDLLVAQVTEGWFKRVYICSPPGGAGVRRSLRDECHPRK